MGRTLSPSLSPFPDAFARADERAAALVPAPHRVLDDTAASSSLGRLAGAPSSLPVPRRSLVRDYVDADSASGRRLRAAPIWLSVLFSTGFANVVTAQTVATFSNAAPIKIPEQRKASPYPSEIAVSGLT